MTKSILQSIPFYVLSIFLLPSTLTKKTHFCIYGSSVRNAYMLCVDNIADTCHLRTIFYTYHLKVPPVVKNLKVMEAHEFAGMATSSWNQ